MNPVCKDCDCIFTPHNDQADLCKGCFTSEQDKKLFTDLGIKPIHQVEYEHTYAVMEKLDYNISKSAKALGIDRRTLQRKINKYETAGCRKREYHKKGMDLQ